MTTTIGSATTTRTDSSSAAGAQADSPQPGGTPVATAPSSVMRPALLPGDTVASDDGRYTLKYQTDGNLVLYVQTGSDPVAIWASKTAGKSAGSVVMQGDGNLVIYGKDGKSSVWSSHTSGHPGSWLMVRRDGNVVICAPEGALLWTTDTWAPLGPAPIGPQMKPGDVLVPGATISSASGTYQFTYQADGNLVLYVQSGSSRKSRWASKTADKPPGSVAMQTDGNLVVYAPGGRELWTSKTAGNPGSRLEVQDDGNVVIYRPGNDPIWSTKTAT
jgi:hypothetical protein